MKNLNIEKLEGMTITDLINLKDHLNKSFIKSDDKYNRQKRAYKRGKTQQQKRDLEKNDKERYQILSDISRTEEAITRKMEGMRDE